MNVNNENSPGPISDTEAAVVASEGKNTELLAVRVSPSLMQAVKLQAERRKQTVPDIVRFLLLFPLVPQLAALAARQLTNEKAETLPIFHSGKINIGKARKLVKETRADCANSRKQLEITEQILDKITEQLDKAEAEASAAWLDYLTELKKSHEDFEADPEGYARAHNWQPITDAPTPATEAAPTAPENEVSK